MHVIGIRINDVMCQLGSSWKYTIILVLILFCRAARID